MLYRGVFGDLEAFEGNFERALFHYEAAADKAQTIKEYQLHEHYRQQTQIMKNKLLADL